MHRLSANPLPDNVRPGGVRLPEVAIGPFMVEDVALTKWEIEHGRTSDVMIVTTR